MTSWALMYSPAKNGYFGAYTTTPPLLSTTRSSSLIDVFFCFFTLLCAFFPDYGAWSQAGGE